LGGCELWVLLLLLAAASSLGSLRDAQGGLGIGLSTGSCVPLVVLLPGAGGLMTLNSMVLRFDLRSGDDGRLSSSSSSLSLAFALPLTPALSHLAGVRVVETEAEAMMG